MSKIHYMKVLLGTSSPQLGARVAKSLGLGILDCEYKKFPDGEFYVRIRAENDDVIVVQSLRSNDDVVVLNLIFDALEDCNITAVIPYFGYARQDKKFQEGESVSIRALARFVEGYADRVISVNLHSEESKRYFNKLKEIDAMPIIGKWLKNNFDDFVLISPDYGSYERVRTSAKYASCEFDYLEKKRISAEKVEITPKEVDVRDKVVIILDDIISTGGTIVTAGKILQEMGAKEVYAVCVHAVFANFALNKLYQSGIREVVSTDTIEKITSKISVAEEIAREIAKKE